MRQITILPHMQRAVLLSCLGDGPMKIQSSGNIFETGVSLL